MTRDDIIRIAREAGLPTVQDTGEILGLNSAIRFANLVAAAEREECAKVCHDKAWELKERSIKETVKTQRARLASEAAGWHDAFTVIREKGAP